MRRRALGNDIHSVRHSHRAVRDNMRAMGVAAYFKRADDDAAVVRASCIMPISTSWPPRDAVPTGPPRSGVAAAGARGVGRSSAFRSCSRVALVARGESYGAAWWATLSKQRRYLLVSHLLPARALVTAAEERTGHFCGSGIARDVP